MDPDVLRRLGLDHEEIVAVEDIHAKGTSRLDRITTNDRAFVLKQTAPNDVEVRCYDLLARLGVPTLTVYARTEQAILLEDLQSSPAWRLATIDEVNRPDVGSAIAEWYARLHSVSRELFSDESRVPSWLRRKPDVLNPDVVYETGRKLGLDHLPVWRLAAEQIEVLKAALLKMPQVLNYNDFHWSNLALSRLEDTFKAVVFDYGEMGIGPRYSDCRNVIGSLGPDAKAAFWQTYGPVDHIEAILDSLVKSLCRSN